MPLGESMINTVKSNKSIRLDKSKHFRKSLGGYNKDKKVIKDLPKASPEQLKEIRQRLKKENRFLWVKVILLAIPTISLLVWMLFAS